ncbi:tetratricopeptide repeat protein [Thalassotalea agariperforans]
MFKKLSTSMVAAVVIMSSSSLSVVHAAEAANAAPAPAPLCPGSLIDGKKRKTQLMGPSVGKKVQAAFDAYTADDINGAIQILLDIDVDDDEIFDKATRARYLAVMYAQKGDAWDESMKYLKEAIAPNVLTEADHGESLKLLADLQMQEKQYKEAVANYYKWMDFTCKNDGNTWVKISQAYYELKQLDKMIEPADNAIKAMKKPSQNPYILKVTSYYERKKYKEAIDVLETVVQVFPGEKQWWTQLGMFYLLVEDYAKSLATLELAYIQGHLVKESEVKTLVQLYSSNQMPYKAAVLLEKHMNEGLITRDDKNLETLANAWHAAMHIADAAKVFGEVAKLTNDAKHYQKQGVLLVQDEQFKPGIAALTKALDLGVKSPGRLHMSIAESHFYLGEFKQAYAAIKKAMEYPQTRKTAKSWEGFIKDTAQRKGKAI